MVYGILLISDYEENHQKSKVNPPKWQGKTVLLIGKFEHTIN